MEKSLLESFFNKNGGRFLLKSSIGLLLLWLNGWHGYLMTRDLGFSRVMPEGDQPVGSTNLLEGYRLKGSWIMLPFTLLESSMLIHLFDSI